MKNNNAGMSIVEIVIVVAMLAILSAGGIYGISQISGFRAREGADTIASSLTQARMAMLGKAKSNGNMAWEIYCKDNRYFVRTVYNVGTGEYYRDEEQIADGKVTVSLGTTTLDVENKTGSTNSVRVLGNDESFRIYFNRSTGALCDSTGAEISEDRYFRVKYGKKDYDVYIIAKTGKIITQSQK